MRNVVHRTQPADPHMRLRLAVFQRQVGDVVRNFEEAERQLDLVAVLRIILHERGPNGREHRAVVVGNCFPAGVQAGLDVLCAHRVVVGMLDVVLARQVTLIGATHHFRQDRRFRREVGLDLRPNAPTSRAPGGDVGFVHADAPATVARAACGSWQEDQTSHLPLSPATAEGGSMVAWAKCGT